jgi:hypothetical protein
LKHEQYSDDEWTDLGALTIQQYPDPAGRLRGWARAFVGGNPTDTLALLKDLSAGVSGWICYQSREDEGTQSPTQTLEEISSLFQQLPKTKIRGDIGRISG